jgi:hypothetical protein
MIKASQISAQNLVALTTAQVLAITNLVKRYPAYRDSAGVWPNLAGKIQAEVTVPTVKTQFLKAVLAQLEILPNEKVEAQGTDKRPSFFSSEDNWASLAQDILDCMYDVPITLGMGGRSMQVVQRRIVDLIIDEGTYNGPIKLIKY